MLKSNRSRIALAAVCLSLLAGCGRNTHAIAVSELPSLSADHYGVHSVWTTEGEVVDVTEPFAVEVRIDQGAKGQGDLETLTFEGPLLAHVVGPTLFVSECDRADRVGDDACRPKIDVPTALRVKEISEVTLTTQRTKDGKAGPGEAASQLWVVPVVLGGVALAGALVGVLAATGSIQF